MRANGSLPSTLRYFILAVLTVSCSMLSKGTSPRAPEGKITSETARQAQEQFSLGKYQKALEIFSNAYDRYHLPGLRHGYSRIGEQIRAAADNAYELRNFAEAGGTYRILFESGITTRDFAQSLSFGDEYLDRQIKACSKALMEIGLIKYREEKLEEAITVWKKILVFDDDNRSVKSAIDTATTQLQQLKHMK